ncbi:hypothetical protein ACXN5S_10585 [Pseudoroseicyclus sp. H15]
MDEATITSFGPLPPVISSPMRQRGIPEAAVHGLAQKKFGTSITADHLSQNINDAQVQHHTFHLRNRRTHAFCLKGVVIFD